MTDSCLRNVVVVEFKQGATREERQAAADRIGGIVVGGNGGWYYLQVADDSTLQVLATAITTLRSLPQVRHASAFSTALAVPDQAHRHLRSSDESGWRQWRLNPADADGRNWAPERIAAPLAWGCSVGDSLTAVAIMDLGFHGVDDLAENLDSIRSVGWKHHATTPRVDHGTRVASVAAARGNNGKAVRSTYRSGAEIPRVAVADDGKALVAHRVFRRLNIVYNVATGGGTYRSLSCNATFQRIVDAPASVSTQQVFYVDGGSRSSCLPGATFGS